MLAANNSRSLDARLTASEKAGRSVARQRTFCLTFALSPIVFAIAVQAVPQASQAHQWHTHAAQDDQNWHAPPHSDEHNADHEHSKAEDASTTDSAEPISLAGPQPDAFAPFSKTVSAYVDGQQLVVESNGLPDHQMMVGIVVWQQQVPLPQPFTGENAWRFPLHPQPAEKPISVLKEPLSGAIALAVNGVPIFCALNNRGEDTLLAGELDEWGGHCGRGDDYHYHAAPVHLEEQVGVGNPIGYALDGYPILGFAEADGSTPKDLDKFNGHKDADGNYHYHATKTFPYINGGLTGVVTMDGNQVKQPRDSPARPSLPPLRGATITGFNQDGVHFDLKYEVDGEESHVKYSLIGDKQVEFSFVDPLGEVSTTTYQRGRNRRGGSIGTYVAAGLLIVGAVATVVLTKKYKRTSSTP